MALPQPSPETTALVTGASSGIGREIARQLAARGHGVTLVARRRPQLEELAAELREAHGVRVEVVPADLADPEGCDGVLREIEALGLEIDVLVNNAGFGVYAPFASSDPAREIEQLNVLVTAVLFLDSQVVPGMVERGRGAVISVSSTSGFQALPGNGTYAAAKAYVLLHSEALHAELKGSGVTVTAVCPGPVRTGFQEASEPLFTERMPGFVWASAERVARDALRAAEKGKRTIIPGGLGPRAFFGLNRVTPTPIALFVAKRLFSQELGRA